MLIKQPLLVKSLLFRNDIHVLRAIAICLVISTHCLFLFNWNHQSFLFHIVDSLLNQGSVIFFFISGYLFQQLSAKFQYSTYLKRKFSSVILPYIILSAVPIYIYTIVTHRTDLWPWFYTIPLWQQIIMFLVTGKQMAPFWFIPTIAIFYIMSPLFIHGDRKNWIYWLIVPALCLSVVFGRNGHYGPINKAMYLLPAYLLGMFYNRYESRIKNWDKEIILTSSFLMAISVYAMTMHISVGLLGQSHSDGLHLIAKLSFVLCYISYFRSKIKVINPIVNWLADASFGLYFLHGFVLSGVRYAWQGAFTTSGSGVQFVEPYISFSAYSLTLLATLLCASVLLFLTKRALGKRSQMIFGY